MMVNNNGNLEEIMRTMFVVVLLLTICLAAYGNSGAPPNNYANNPPNNNNCTTCHSGNDVNGGDGEFLISLDIEEYMPGETYAVTVSLSDPGQSRWGFELTVQDENDNMAGSFTVTDETNTQLSDQGGDNPDFMKQTSTGTFSGDDEATWTFDWTAPEEGAGDVTFYASGNAANGNFTTSGDFIYTQSLAILEGGGGATAPEPFSLLTPLDEAVVNELEVALTWEEAVDQDPDDVVTYEIYASTEEGNVTDNMVGTSETESYTFTGDDDTEYFWTVKAVDTNTDGTWANETWSFAIAVPEVPAAFDLDTPADEYVSESLMVSLAWLESTDPDPGDMISYEVYVSDEEETVMDNMVGTTESLTYDFEGLNSSTYWWTIKAVDTNTDGTWASSIRSFSIDEVGVDDNVFGVITDWKLEPAYPNPFNAETRFILSVPNSEYVSVAVFDLLGREVTRLHSGNLGAGVHSFSWYADTPAGIYFLQVQSASGFKSVQKLVLLK